MSLPDVSRHLFPERSRPEIEWSVALSRDAASTDRFVVYGLSEDETRAFLAARGHDPGSALSLLEGLAGPPAQVAVGKDGDRTKVYWFLETDDPYFLGLDLRPGRAPAVKRYRLLSPERIAEAAPLLEEPLREPLRRLLHEPPFSEGGLFHLVLLSRDEPVRYTGFHAGILPEWERLLARDRSLLRAGLVERFLSGLGLGGHLDLVRRELLSPPMAWTAYLSALLRPDGSIGANVYTRADPVVAHEGGGLAIVEPGRGGVRPRPVLVSARLRSRPEVEVRLRAGGEARCYEEVGGWRLDYRAISPVPGIRAEDLVASGFLREMSDVAARAAAAGGPLAPIDALRALRADPRVLSARAGPDMA